MCIKKPESNSLFVSPPSLPPVCCPVQLPAVSQHGVVWTDGRLSAQAHVQEDPDCSDGWHFLASSVPVLLVSP